MNTAPVRASPRIEIQYEQTGLRSLLAEDSALLSSRQRARDEFTAPQRPRVAE
jgi:hypothetical protein